MPKKNRIAIYELLFKEGVMVAKKDVHMPKHPELADKNVPNLHVMKAMQVFWGYQALSRGEWNVGFKVPPVGVCFRLFVRVLGRVVGGTQSAPQV